MDLRLQCNKMADSTTNEPVCVLKKIKETNVNVKEQRVGESRLRAIDSVCVFLFFPQLHEGEQKACTLGPLLRSVHTTRVCLFFHLEGGRQICHENTRR